SFSLTRPPPRPPLFPYTTLFRSHHPGDGRPARRRLLRLVLRAGVRRRGVPAEKSRADALAAVGRRVRLPVLGRVRRPDAPANATDRKSTRLNSSHRTISYAVFCL